MTFSPILKQLGTALAAMARLELMTVRNTWRFWPQRLVSCVLATQFGQHLGFEFLF